jgi:hypothetical protein
LLDDSSSADINIVLDHGISVALNTRRKRNKIPNYAIVSHIAVNIAVEMASDLDIAGERYERAKNCPSTQLNRIQLNDI